MDAQEQEKSVTTPEPKVPEAQPEKKESITYEGYNIQYFFYINLLCNISDLIVTYCYFG